MTKGSCSQTLIESDPVVVKPDQSHKLTCTASGLDMDINTAGPQQCLCLVECSRGIMSWPLLLLISFFPYVHCISLTSSPAEVKPPGASVRLSCQISGYALTSYGTAWIRQRPGKALEWIGIIWGGGSINTGASFKTRFSISRDTSSNVLYLDISGLVPEDTAVYYCAKTDVGGHYFDYWGKGTQVTVTSVVQGPPKSLFPLWQCGSSSDGLVTLGCITQGLATADGLTFSWTDASGTALTNIVQYPAVLADGGYTSVSQVRVKASDWSNSKQFKCQVKNSQGELKKDLKKPAGLAEHPPSVLLTASTQTELDNGTVTFICLAEHYSTKNGQFIWTIGKDQTDAAKPPIISQDKGVSTAVSVLEISASAWTSSPVECKVSQKAGTVKKVAKYASGDAQSPKAIIIPPSQEDMLINRVGILECRAEGLIGFTAMKWLIGQKEVVSLPSKNTSEKTLFSLKTKINFEDWGKGTKFTCEVQHPTFVHVYDRVYFERVNGKTEDPKVYLLAPPESSEDSVTLTCYVKDFYPKEVAVSWLVDDKHVEGSKQNTSSVIERDDLFSVYSKLMVKTADWKSGTVYTCRVYHESIDEAVRLISRSISSNSDPPTIMNLSLNVPSACYTSKNCNESAF